MFKLIRNTFLVQIRQMPPMYPRLLSREFLTLEFAPSTHKTMSKTSYENATLIQSFPADNEHGRCDKV